MRSVWVLLLITLCAVPAFAGVVKWQLPDGRVGFAAKAEDVPQGARILSASPPAAPARAQIEDVSLCEFETASVAELVKVGLRELDWDDPEMRPLRNAKRCAFDSAHRVAVNFRGACRYNIARGIETEDQAFERLLTNTLIECSDVPANEARAMKVPDPGLRGTR